jgi:hypothetical protein
MMVETFFAAINKKMGEKMRVVLSESKLSYMSRYDRIGRFDGMLVYRSVSRTSIFG